MTTTKTERIVIDLPQDIILAMRGLEDIKKKLKIALAIFLFQEKSISLGKATELAEMSRVRFTEILKEHGIAAFEYTEKDYEKDQETLAHYQEIFKNEGISSHRRQQLSYRAGKNKSVFLT